MRALIFAAGRGERMRPLTDTTPKPLLKVRGKPLIVHHLEHLAAIGVHYIVINTSHLAEQFPDLLGDGSDWGMRIRYAYEGENALETGGGMLNALPLLDGDPFIAINGDVYTDFDLATLPGEPQGLAHLVMVENPLQHPDGDFGLDESGQITLDARIPRLTFAGVGVYRPELLDNWRDTIGTTPGADAKPPRFKLAPILRAAIAAGHVTGRHFGGSWSDVGTPARLAAINT